MIYAGSISPADCVILRGPSGAGLLVVAEQGELLL
ncbi:hypothetical protein MNBD_GAMMA25-2350 [hydrothermal vent metagenome]|uniref:Uncharacterized protein n=1 Tax=hydrothermal vent metagenome TaxID=652676 RepID=A0A3B1BH13_9ZZZZ